MAIRKVSLGYNAVPKSAKTLIHQVFESGQYSPGPMVKQFEREFAYLHNTRYGIFVNSGTDALRLSLLAMKEKYGWRQNDLIAVTTQTFVATINAILQAGLKPFFFDAGNPWNLERRLNCSSDPINIRAMMVVHLYGAPADIYHYRLAKENNWPIIEDSCETILNEVKGDVSCYSTYMAHHVTTGVGGLALTNDPELNRLIRSYANHGRSNAYIPGYEEVRTKSALIRSRFIFERSGYSCRATEFEAALGLSQIKGLNNQINKRRQVAQKLCQALMKYNSLFHFHDPGLMPDHTFMMFPILINERETISKYDLCLHLENRGIETRDMMPITNQPCFEGLVKEQDFPVSAHINKNGFYIACHPGVTDADVKTIKNAFDSYLRK
jgi:perosamine synthetase